MPSPRPLTSPRRRSLQAFSLASVFVLGSAFACSKESPPTGQIMLALQTDMSLPKDVNKVRIQVLQDGNVKFDRSYFVGGATDAKIPATLGIVGNGESENVEVRVIGFRGDVARTLNKVLTTIPTSRIALLRMPIQWLCEGFAKEVASDTYESTCAPSGGQETSCLGGACQPVGVQSNTLPNYEPREVFGGASGPNSGGTCFTTETCFDSGFDAQPNMNDCSVDVMAAPNEPLNFAVKTPANGDGICSGGNCYVPLDREEQFGWREPAAGTGGSTGTDIPDASTGKEEGGIAPVPTDAGDVTDSGRVDSGTGTSDASAGPAPSGSFEPPPLPSNLEPQQTQPQGLRHIVLPKGVC
ncbi:MAG TPA: hypothetical protein VGP93_11225, partial [Polyangiaceae bacterium]|nr:hypothetical protein [Polyangiaceae bacterium]